jgi:mannitol-1-phosphate 5-dehydrogenase
MNKKILIWGAGKIGRGFIADIFAQAGFEICLVDESQDLINQLNKRGKYTVVHAGSEKIEQIFISGYKALTTAQESEIAEEFKDTDLMALAIFPKIFEAVACQIRQYILQRKGSGNKNPFNILLCTNLIHAGPKFKEYLYKDLTAQEQQFLEDMVGIVEVLVIRISPAAPAYAMEKDPLVVWTNGYPELPVDKHGFKGSIPAVKSLRLVDDMRAEELRKIYTYNMCHALLSYHGKFYGYPLLVDCLKDDAVSKEAEGALDEVSAALQKEFGFTAKDMQAWIKSVLEHTNNPTVADTVARSGADPKRKLARDDRLIGPTLLCLKNGITPRHLIKGIAAAFHYYEESDPSSKEIQETIKWKGIREAIKQYCGLGKGEEDLLEQIAAEYDRVPLEHEWVKKSRQAYQLGMEYEQKYHGCGQSVIAAVTEVLGIFNEEVFKTATGLCGGIGLINTSTCSAYIGGVMAIGLVFPREHKNFGGDRENKYKNFELVQQLHQKYMEEFGTNYCAELHKKKYGRSYDLREKPEREKFELVGSHEENQGCTDIAGKASQWTIEVLAAPLIERELSKDT